MEIKRTGSHNLSREIKKARLFSASQEGVKEPALVGDRFQSSADQKANVAVEDAARVLSKKRGIDDYLIWKTPIAGEAGYLPPVIAPDGNIHLASSDYYLSVVTPEGQVKGKTRIGEKGYTALLGLAADGSLYLSGDDNHLYAFNPEGKLKWKLGTESYRQTPPAFSPDGTIYVGSGRELSALSPQGELKWKLDMGGLLDYSRLLVSPQGTVYLSSDEGSSSAVAAVTPEGKLQWKTKIEDQIQGRLTIAEDGTLYALNGEHPKRLYALSPEGKLKWKVPVPAVLEKCPVPAPDGSVYLFGHDNKVYAFSPEGKVKWNYQAEGVLRKSPVVDKDGTVYYTTDRYLCALTPEGKSKWRVENGDWSCSPLAISPEGRIYLWKSDGNLYAFNPKGNFFELAGEAAVSPGNEKGKAKSPAGIIKSQDFILIDGVKLPKRKKA